MASGQGEGKERTVLPVTGCVHQAKAAEQPNYQCLASLPMTTSTSKAASHFCFTMQFRTSSTLFAWGERGTYACPVVAVPYPLVLLF
eukprot:scaffold73895_cov19-Tisochrysis_lutea.AAC.3